MSEENDREIPKALFFCPTCDTATLVCTNCGDKINTECTCVEPPEGYCMVCTGVFKISWHDEDEIVDGEIVEEDPGPIECKCNPIKDWFCSTCKVQRTTKDSPWRTWEPNTKYTPKCRHYGEEVVFPNGVIVLASSQHKHDPKNAPDWGLYCDYYWEPACRAEYINWPDFDIPKYPEVAAEAIIDAFESASEGWKVEVGCMGGHGRTGTVLGCMAVMAGTPWGEAVEWVLKNYCIEAIETKQQEWWIKWFSAYFLGEDLPTDMPESKYKSYTSTSSWTSSDDIAWGKGWGETDSNLSGWRKKDNHNVEKCNCDTCRYKRAGFGALADPEDKRLADDVIDAWERALEAVGDKDVADAIATQRMSGHYPEVYQGYTVCNQCEVLWPCEKSGQEDDAVIPGTESGDWIYVSETGWTWKTLMQREVKETK